MKRILLIAVIILFTTSSFGQKIRFSDSTNVWHYLYVSTGIVPAFVWSYTDYYIGDTAIHGTTYRQLQHNYENAYIREDSVSKKVYAIMTSPPDNDSLEQLLYDYTLNVGDTFRNLHETYYVYNIDSVIINSIWHKVWHFHHSSFVYDYDVIEGIGSTYDPCFPITPFGTIEGGDILICFNNRGTTPPLSDTVGPYFNNSTSCTLTSLLGVNNVVNKNQNVSIIPNPTYQTSKIVFSYNIPSGSLTVFNDIGQAIINTTFQIKDEVLIGDKINTPGIYFYRVTDNQSGKTFSGKFVSQ